jgi:hypothetical protein
MALAAALCAPALGQTPVRKPADVVEVTVTGQGMTKDDALRDAKRKAIEKGAGSYIYSQSKVKNFVLVRDTILARSAGFVQSVKVLSEQKMEDGTWEVRIKAVVSVKGIRDTWGVVKNLLKDMGRPKVMVFIREKIDRRAQDSSTVQTRIENVLLKSGFLLVDEKQLKAIDRKDMAAAIDEDNPERLQAIAKRFGAQLFVTGVANAASGGPKMIYGVRQFTYEAEANVRCYRSDTAQLLASVPGAATRGVQRVPRSAAKQALDAQARQLAPKVRYDILRFWQDVLEGRGEVQLLVENVSFKQYLQIRNALKQLKNVKDVKVTFHNNNAECSIECDLTAEKLAEKVVELLSDLEITDVTQNVIKARWKQEEAQSQPKGQEPVFKD